MVWLGIKNFQFLLLWDFCLLKESGTSYKLSIFDRLVVAAAATVSAAVIAALAAVASAVVAVAGAHKQPVSPRTSCTTIGASLLQACIVLTDASSQLLAGSQPVR